jgi:hypothetical protein
MLFKGLAMPKQQLLSIVEKNSDCLSDAKFTVKFLVRFPRLYFFVSNSWIALAIHSTTVWDPS